MKLPRRVALKGLFVCTAALALGAGACGGKQLESASQARSFIKDVAEGAKAGEWKLTGSASSEAQTAWRHRGAIAALGESLHEGPEWACKAADLAEKAGKAKLGDLYEEMTISDAGRQRITSQLQREDSADPAEVDDVIAKALRLTDAELVEIIANSCQAAEI